MIHPVVGDGGRTHPESDTPTSGSLPEGQAAQAEARITDPPAALRSRNPLAWFRFFGPGAIVASVTVGSGEIVFPSRGGALFGYELLWIYPAVALLKWGMAYASMRHIILSGAHPLQRWTYLPGPRGWLPLAIVAVSVLCLPLWYSWLSGILGTHSAQVSGVADHCFWATTWALVAIALLWRGGYHFLEKAQILILAIMLLAVFVAVFFVQPDWLAALKGFLLPHALQYPDWAFQVVPKLRERSEWVEVLVYVSVIGGGAEDYLAYVAFLREKRWGRSHLPAIAGNQLREVAARRNHPGRIWIRAALIDTVTSFLCVVLIAVAFTLMGALILQPQRLVPDGLELVSYQAAFLTGLAGWLKPLYDLAIFLAFFGILLGGPEMAYRLWASYLDSLPALRRRVNHRLLRAAAIGWTLIPALIILWTLRWLQQTGAVEPGFDLLDLVTPAGIFTSFVASFFCFANIWADRRFLPPPLRAPALLQAVNLVAGGAFLFTAVRAMGSYQGVLGYGFLILLLAGCMLAARRMRFLYEENPA